MASEHKCEPGKRHCDFEGGCCPASEFDGDEHQVEPLHFTDNTVPWDSPYMREHLRRRARRPEDR